jgi:hypothetical protein
LHDTWLIVCARLADVGLLLRGWQALDDNSDPPLNVHISLPVVLDDSITLPNCFSPELDYLIHKSLYNSDAKIIIL